MTYPSVHSFLLLPQPLTQPPGCCGFINLHPRTFLLLRNRFTRVNSPPPSQGLRIWSFSRDGLWACRWAVRRENLLFPPLHFFADLLSSLSGAVRKRICPPGVQTHFSSRLNLFLLWGLMRALVCRSLPHAGGGSPRQLPHLSHLQNLPKIRKKSRETVFSSILPHISSGRNL